VLVCCAYLRSIAHGDLADAKSVHFVPIDQLPTPSGPRPRDRGNAGGDGAPAQSTL
jgi:hypothetical protein